MVTWLGAGKVIWKMSSCESPAHCPNTTTEELPMCCDNPPSAGSIFNLVQNSSCDISYTISAEITKTDICSERADPFPVYVISVTKSYKTGSQEVWDVLREYGDFDFLHSKLVEKYEDLAVLSWPGKLIFNKKDKEFLEKWLPEVNTYLQILLQPSHLDSHEGLLTLTFNFLEHRVWDRERYPLDREISVFEQFKRKISCYTANPVEIAEYWKDVVDNHVEEVLGCSVEGFVKESAIAVDKVRECAANLAKVCKDCGIATTVGGSAGVVAGGMGITGLILAPFTAGLSLGLTLGAAGLGIAAGATSAGAGVANVSIKKAKLKELQADTNTVVNTLEIFEGLLKTCVDAFTNVEKFLETDEGKEYRMAIADACNSIQKTSPIHTNAESKVKDALSITAGTGSLTKGLAYGSARAIQRTVGVAKFIKSGAYAQAGMKTVYALETSADGLAIGGRSLIMAGSTGAKALTAGFGVLSIGMGVFDIVRGAIAIGKPNEAVEKLQDFASNLENSTKELQHIYDKLTGISENKQCVKE